MTSPAFSSFRELMNLWEEAESSVKIDSLIQNNELVLFFKKEGIIYGSSESGRVTFAKMKNPDKDLPDGWLEEANFVAYDLERAMKGQKIQRVFSHKDLKEIKILDEEDVKKKLGGKGEPADLDTDKEDPTAPDAAKGIEKLDEK
jgi:hypothetical protein